MWSATLAFNGLTTAGIGDYGFPNHMMGHSLSALYNVDHGASLSIVFPAWLKYNESTLSDRLAHFGKEVFGKAGAKETIAAIEEYFHAIGAPVRLSEVNIDKGETRKIAENAVSLAKNGG